jgi:glutamyl-Q tRNA(Asp) synthetase
VARALGDFVVRRADGLFAYQLAVVVDDAAQGVSDVVRGADLLASTPRQIYLQRLLGLPQPRYLHLPVALDAAGNKLGKQTRAPALEKRAAAATLCRALAFLGQEVPPEAGQGAPREVLAWAAAHWEPRRFSGVRQRPAV